jgi:hypothetical protein
MTPCDFPLCDGTCESIVAIRSHLLTSRDLLRKMQKNNSMSHDLLEEGIDKVRALICLLEELSLAEVRPIGPSSSRKP